MAENTKIEWCDDSINLWRGCAKVAPGCQNCYAEAQERRFGTEWGKGMPRVSCKGAFDKLRVLNAKAGREERKRRVFINSLSDFFEDHDGTVVDHEGEQVFRHIVSGEMKPYDDFSMVDPAAEPLTLDDLRTDAFKLFDELPNLILMLLTKRPENIRAMWPGVASQTDDMTGGDVTNSSYRPNVWLYTSISEQESADRNIPLLLECRDLVAVLGVSAEPLLGEIDLLLDGECSDWHCPHCNSWNVEADIPTLEGGCWLCHDCKRGAKNDTEQIDWVSKLNHVIVGGESGPGARLCTIGHIRSLVDQCKSAGVPAFVKQLGANPVNREGEHCPSINHPKGGDMGEWPEDLRVRQMPKLAETKTKGGA